MNWTDPKAKCFWASWLEKGRYYIIYMDKCSSSASLGIMLTHCVRSFVMFSALLKDVSNNPRITEATVLPPELQQLWWLKMWLSLHGWTQQRLILGGCWLARQVLITCSSHSTESQFMAESRPTHFTSTSQGTQPLISPRGNLEPICVM